MASSFTKKRFRAPESVEHTIENVKKSTPRSTMYKNRWAVRIFEEWQVVRENKQANREENPFKLNLEAVENLNKPLSKMSLASMNFWLIKFILNLLTRMEMRTPKKPYIRLCVR